MRLTLRTLLAYLEDELKPSESKEIGQKIAASPVATSLAQRIREVMRRRRLSAEDLNETGLDANLVAEYLDGSLSAQEVADVEKVCLGSDAHLAEVAACHQILTLVLGEPVEISEASRERMYALADDGTAGRFEAPLPPEEQAVSPADEPTPFPEHLMRKPWWKKAYPIMVPAALLGLWVIIIGYAVPSLNPFREDPEMQITAIDDETVDAETSPIVAPRHEQEPEISTVQNDSDISESEIDPEPPPDMPEPGNETGSETVAATDNNNQAATPLTPAEVKPGTADNPKPDTNNAATNPPAAKPQVVGRYQSSEGVLLMHDLAKSGWYTVPYELKLLDRSELIVPKPFSAIIKMEQSAPLLTLEGGTKIEFTTKSPAAPVGLKLETGRILLEAVDANTTAFAVQVGELNWRIELIGANSRAGLELVQLPVYGYERPLPKNHFVLKLLIAQGGARVANSAGDSLMLNEHQQVMLHNPPVTSSAPADPSAPPTPQPEPGQLTETMLKPIGLLPDWLQHPQPEPSRIQRRYQEDFAAQFDPVLGAAENMDPLIEDDRPQMVEYAISCLGLIGDYEGLIKALRVSHFESTRLQAANLLRLWIPRHRDNRTDYLSRLELSFSDDAVLVDRLLWGFTPEDATDAMISEELISELDHPLPTISQLVFLEIARLTGLENGYRAFVSPTQRRVTIQRWERIVREEGALVPAETPTDP